MAEKRTSDKSKSHRVFGPATKTVEVSRACVNVRVSTNDQRTILRCRSAPYGSTPLGGGWTIALDIESIGSGAAQRELRQIVIEAASRRALAAHDRSRVQEASGRN